MKINKIFLRIMLFTAVIIFLFSSIFIIKKQIIDRQTVFNKNQIVTFEDMKNAVKERNGYYINTAVLYIKDDDNYTAETALEYLNQSVSVGLNVSSVDISKEMPSLDKFDILYLDESLVNCKKVPEFVEYIMSYVKNGGNVFVANDLYKIFPKNFIGAKKFVKLNDVPHDLNITKVDNDLKPLQELIVDFSNLYKDFSTKKSLENQNYGVVVVPDSAVALVLYKNEALYTINKFENGLVFFTNKLLPNKYSKSSFSLKKAKFEQGPFSNTTATFNQLIYSYFPSYISKRIYGFSLNRIFGSYTAPSMAWSLHYENQSGIKANTLKTFSELVEKYNQIPSFSIVRNSLHWYTRKETMVYLLNSAKNKKDYIFKTDLYENPFASGKYIGCDNKWIQLSVEEHVPPGLGGDITKKVLSFPFLIDYDKDGLLDVFSGSKDGDMYFLKGKGFTGKDRRFTMEKPRFFRRDLSYSSPSIIDIDGDGELDIITGSGNGNIYFLKGYGNFIFHERKLLIKTDIQGLSLPIIGDINGDGVPDIVVGSDTGVLIFYYGTKNGKSIEYSYKRMGAISRQCTDLGLGKYLSPFVVDYNKDGIADIIIGTEDGYVAKLKGNKNGKYDFDGFFLTDEMNINGNYNLKFGMFCNPRLLDINNDGRLDFVVGYEDADLPYPVDSIYYPYKKELLEAINYAKLKKYYIGMHYFLGGYASAVREKYEINTHLNMLKSFGVDCKKIGVNQHTGPITKISEIDSYNRLYDSGLLWDSYFVETFDIHTAAENAIVNPFFMIHNNQRKLLMQNISSAILCQSDKPSCKRKNYVYESSKYESPVLNYHHPDGLDPEMDEEFASYADKYKNDFSYNFVKENQMMFAIAAAYNLNVSMKIKDDSIEIIPEPENNKFPLYDKNYQDAVGVKIEFSSNFKDKLNTDSPVWREKDNSLYIGLNNTISLFENNDELLHNHLIRVNIPAKIDKTYNGVDLSFLDDGMMQAAVVGYAYTDSKNWKMQYKDGITEFTKFGKKDSLHIIYGE